jgi:hypothetical protein
MRVDEIWAPFAADPATARRVTYEKIGGRWREVITTRFTRVERTLRPYEKLRLGIVAGENATV